MTKYDVAVVEAQAFAEKHRDASVPIMILIAKTSDSEDGESFTIEKVATVSHFTESVQKTVIAIAAIGEEVAKQGVN